MGSGPVNPCLHLQNLPFLRILSYFLYLNYFSLAPCFLSVMLLGFATMYILSQRFLNSFYMYIYILNNIIISLVIAFSLYRLLWSIILCLFRSWYRGHQTMAYGLNLTNNLFLYSLGVKNSFYVFKLLKKRIIFCYTWKLCEI